MREKIKTLKPAILNLFYVVPIVGVKIDNKIIRSLGTNYYQNYF